MNQGCPASYLVSEDLSWDIPGTTLGKKHIPKHGFVFEGYPMYNFYAQKYPKILRDKLGYPGLSQGPGISRDIPAYPDLYHRCSFPDVFRQVQVPVGLFKLKRRGFEAPLKRQKWFGDLLANTSK